MIYSERTPKTFLIISLLILLGTSAHGQDTSKIVPDIFHGDTTEIAAQYPGGAFELNQFIYKNIRYPELAKEMREQGVVYVQFIIKEDGSISDISIVKGVSPLIDSEVIRLLSIMPNWIPGTLDGTLCRTRYTLPITFKLN